MNAILPQEQAGSDLPAGYPLDYIETVTLRDGLQVILRPIRPDDAPRLQEGFNRLSQRSVYLRFLESFRQLPDEQAENFARLDYANRMALVVEIQEHSEPHLIGVARYALIGPDAPGLAESAVVVVDEFQGKGLGTLLLDRLVKHARTHGVYAFTATVHISNTQIMRFIKKSGLRSEKKMLEPGVWEIHIYLSA
ncbi:MAG TPA: GNAT family N-acetyltransferase [Anaerolineales bacterium]